MGKGRPMIVFYTQPNTLKLPYEIIKKVEARDRNGLLIYDEKDNIKLISKKDAEYFVFIPGKNTISNKLWIKIVEYNKRNWEYYSTILRVFKGKVDKKTEIEIGENEDRINLDTLNVLEMKELIENTMDIDDIDRYLKVEKKRDEPRSSILKTIKMRKAKISEADKAFNNDDKKV